MLSDWLLVSGPWKCQSGAFLRLGQQIYFFFVRVAPPRLRSVTPDSESTRWMKPYDRPVSSASARILEPFSYFLTSCDPSLSRAAPVIRLPFFSSAIPKMPSLVDVSRASHSPATRGSTRRAISARRSPGRSVSGTREELSCTPDSTDRVASATSDRH